MSTTDACLPVLFFLPNVTPQLPAKFAHALPVDVLGTTAAPLPELVVRLRLRSKFDMPSDAEPSGEGVSKPPSGGKTTDCGREADSASERAIVGAALDGEEAIAKGGRAECVPLDGRDDVLDRNDGGRGRSGERRSGDDVLIVGRGCGEGEWLMDDGLFGVGGVDGRELGRDVATGSDAEACARTLDKEDGPGFGLLGRYVGNARWWGVEESRMGSITSERGAFGPRGEPCGALQDTVRSRVKASRGLGSVEGPL